MTAPAPPKRPPGPPPKSPPPAVQQAAPTGPINISKGRKLGRAEKIGVYGPGGIGKSSMFELAAAAGFKPLVLDLESGTGQLAIDRIEQDQLQTFDAILNVLADTSLWAGYDMVGIDTMTVAEQLAVTWTLANVPKQIKGGVEQVKNLKAYGWGDGDTYVYETMLKLFAALDRHVQAGRWVLAVAHDFTARVENPNGENFIRYEPRLLSSKQGNVSARFREWLDHLLFIGYDIAVNSEGKAVGGGTRTFYTQERPSFLAKTRSSATVPETVVYEPGSPEIFNLIKQANTGA